MGRFSPHARYIDHGRQLDLVAQGLLQMPMQLLMILIGDGANVDAGNDFIGDGIRIQAAVNRADVQRRLAHHEMRRRGEFVFL